VSSPNMDFKKKLYQFHPQRQPIEIETFRTSRKNRREKVDVISIERGVRQLLADKITGNLVGLWLLAPEHLRLGTWDLLKHWAGPSPCELSSRLGMQLVHEAALGVVHLRTARCLSQKGFEVLNGMPFVASDQSIHDLLNAHTVQQAEAFQYALGCIRRARGHFQGQLLAIDPHRLPSASQRQMLRYRDNGAIKPYKVSSAYFCLDAQTRQPVCFLLTSSSMTVSQLVPRLLQLSARILNPAAESRPLVVADNEHLSQEILEFVSAQTPFDILIPMTRTKSLDAALRPSPKKTFNLVGPDMPQLIAHTTSNDPPTLITVNSSNAPVKARTMSFTMLFSLPVIATRSMTCASIFLSAGILRNSSTPIKTSDGNAPVR